MPVLNVTPSKHIYDALAQDIDLNQAISDLIDNATDNWKIQKRKNPLTVNILISVDKIEIKDDSGGIDFKTLPLLLMPGGTNRTGQEEVKGIWGVGSKRALFSLGKKFKISTRKKDETGLILEVNESWFKEDEKTDKWKIEYKEDNTLEEGVTILTIDELKMLLNPYLIMQIRKNIARTYKDELQEGSLKIIFNKDSIKLIPEIPWAKSEYAPPTRYITDIPVPQNKKKIHLEITAGIMTKPGENYSYGIDFIGNKRVILQNNLDWRMGFEKDRLGLPHPTINRFRAIVRITGDSRDIPWNSAKSDINSKHPMYVPIVDVVFQVSRQYVSFLRKNYDKTAKLFTEKADETDIEDIIFDYNKEFKRVVKEIKESKDIERIIIDVPKEDFNELVRYYGLEGKQKKIVGLFIFNKVLKEVKGLAKED